MGPDQVRGFSAQPRTRCGLANSKLVAWVRNVHSNPHKYVKDLINVWFLVGKDHYNCN